MVAGFHIHMLHTAQREVVFAEEAVIRKDGQDVGQRVADAKDGFHRAQWDLSHKYTQYLRILHYLCKGMDKKTKNILRYVFWLLVAALLVYFCIRKIDWSEFRQALAYCRWSYVVLSMLLGVLVFFVRGCRWRMLLLPIDPHTSRITCFNAYNICMAVNLAVPRAGEVARLGYVVKHSSKDSEGKRLMTFDKALGTLLIERIWDVIVTLGMAAVLFIFKWEDFGTALLKDSPSITIKNSLWWILGMGMALVVLFLFLAWNNRSREGF